MTDHPAKVVLDAGAATLAVTTFIGWLPAVAALLTVVWTAIRIYETKTVQRLLGKIQ